MNSMSLTFEHLVATLKSMVATRWWVHMIALLSYRESVFPGCERTV